MGHEYCGIVEAVGSEVRNIKVGDFVVGSFVISDNTCEICQAGYQSRCIHGEFVSQTIGTQSELARIPLADGTLVATPGLPPADLIPHLLAASDVLSTGWFGAVAAEAGPGKSWGTARLASARCWRPVSRCRAHHRPEPEPEGSRAGAEVRRNRHRDRARG